MDTFIRKMSSDTGREVLLTRIPESLADRFVDSFSERVDLNLYSDDIQEGSYDIAVWKEGHEVRVYSLSAEELSYRSSSSAYMLYRLAGDPQSQISKAIQIINELLELDDDEEEEEEEWEGSESLDEIVHAMLEDDSSAFPTERSPEQWDESTVPTIFDTKDLESQLP